MLIRSLLIQFQIHERFAYVSQPDAVALCVMLGFNHRICLLFKKMRRKLIYFEEIWDQKIAKIT